MEGCFGDLFDCLVGFGGFHCNTWQQRILMLSIKTIVHIMFYFTLCALLIYMAFDQYFVSWVEINTTTTTHTQTRNLD